MQLNILLKKYIGFDEHRDIMNYARQMYRDKVSSDEILKTVDRDYGHLLIDRFIMRDNPIPYRLWGVDLIDWGAINQMDIVARLPVTLKVAGMGDMHLGYEFPIGSVVALDNVVSPGGVGYDIACQVNLTELDIPAQEVIDNKEEYADMLECVTGFGMGAHFEGKDVQDHDVMYSHLWKIHPALKKMKGLAQSQLGTAGAGNHFANLVHIEATGNVGLLTHSGSRKLGHSICKEYREKAIDYVSLRGHGVPKEYGWLPVGSELGEEYIVAAGLARDYANACHEIIHERFEYVAGGNKIKSVKSIHNFFWFTADNGVVHRKGATPADLGTYGVIPGTATTNSKLVVGQGNPDSMNSSSHGAGRPRSRTASKKEFNLGQFEQEIRDSGVVFRGWAKDETQNSYKDIEAVMLSQEDLVQVISELIPIISIMGGKEDPLNI